MRKLIVSFVYLIGVSASMAQESDTIDLKDLNVPASPGFYIVGVHPAQITKPNSPKALALSVMEATDNGTSLPGNYSLEFSPYWLTNNKMSYKEYFNLEKSKPLHKTFISNFAFSAASATNKSDSMISLGIGFRSLLVEGKARGVQQELFKLRQQHNALLERIKNIDDDAVLQRIQDSINATNSDIRKTALEVQRLNKEKIGHQLEVAGAWGWQSNSTFYDSLKYQRFGLWLTYSYTPESEKMDFVNYIILLRLIRDKVNTNTSGLDFGGKLRFRIAEKFFVSGEWLKRIGIQKASDATPDEEEALLVTVKSDYRYSFNLEYPVKDNIILIAAFGRNLPLPGQTGAGDLVAFVGLNFGLGQIILK